jgi:predicted Rossmann fold nucleotide-binding protein DprA/Smf involved in DNA uptake
MTQLTHEPLHVDEIVRALNRPTEEVTSALALMELKGIVRQASGNSYVLAREERVRYRVD